LGAGFRASRPLFQREKIIGTDDSSAPAGENGGCRFVPPGDAWSASALRRVVLRAGQGEACVE
jgi:hypothetical protein